MADSDAVTTSGSGVGAEAHMIQGRRVSMPVHIRQASVATAMFAVPAAAAQQIIDYTGLEVAQPLPGKAICTLAFIDYQDGDLDTYHEFGVTFLVRRHDAPGPRPTGRIGGLKDLAQAGAFIHWLPVDQGFTLEAGRSIWGFPKLMTDIPMRLDGRTKRCAVKVDGKTVIEVQVKTGLPVPMPMPGDGGVISAYSCLDGVTRHIPWTMAPSGVRSRLGGAKILALGDHPVADELRRLGLGQARAFASSTIPRLKMVFDGATDVHPAAPRPWTD